ncbi:MAG: hypothetical protein WC774_03170 [Candidatus Gracilibacteria bacterium]
MNDLVGREIIDETQEGSFVLSPEASHRIAGIIKGIRGRFLINGKNIAKTFLFQLHEMIDEKEISEDKRIISREDLEILLYAPEIERKEIRRIIATIIYRTEILLADSDAKAAKSREKLERHLKKKK